MYSSRPFPLLLAVIISYTDKYMAPGRAREKKRDCFLLFRFEQVQDEQIQ